MLRIVICDDSDSDREAARQGVEAYLADHPEWNGKADVFSTPSDLLDALENGAVWDIALLDVYMPGVLGTEVARELLTRLEHLNFLFLTTSPDFAVEAFALGAVHYLIKPFTVQQLYTALDRAAAPYGKRERKSILLYLENGTTHSVLVEEIAYIESVGHCRLVHTADGSFDERRQTLTALYDQLQILLPGQFIVPYRGYIVNQSAIRTITAQEIQLHNGTRIPMRRDDFRKIRGAYFQWLFEKEGEG